MYTKSDLTRAFLSIGTDGLSLRHLGVQAMSNSKKRDELEKFKTFMLQLNTAGGDIYDLASIFTSDSMVELIQNARNSRMYAERRQQQQQQQQMQLNQQQIEAEAREKELQRQHELAIEDKKGQYRVLQEKIQAAGRAADAKSDATSLNYLPYFRSQPALLPDLILLPDN